MAHFLKNPTASLDYTIDWNAGYLADETVSASSWTIIPAEPDGLAVTSEIQTGLRTSAIVGGGVPGHYYQLSNTVVLSNGRTDSRSISIRVEQR